MKKFKLDTECIKCGFKPLYDKYPKVEYVKANSLYAQIHEEFILRTCRCCGFTWRELPLDMEVLKD